MKVIIITPACNEELHLPELIESMVNQNFLPSEWIIVDDGSLDNTSHVIKKAAINHDWIKYLRKEKSTLRAPGRSVIETFYFGFNKIETLDYDIVIKLDADLVLPVNYLQTIANCFQKDPALGICGGICVIKNSNKQMIEQGTNLDHVRGAIKAYRRDCFESIGGLLYSMGWDTVDEHLARYNKWRVLVIPNLHVLHQRATNQEFGFSKAAFRNGKMLYSIRMDIFLLFGNCLKRCFTRPYFVLSIAMFMGYIFAFLTKHPKIVQPELGKFIRKYRYEKILQRFFN